MAFFFHIFERIVRRFLNDTFDSEPFIQTAPKKIIYLSFPKRGMQSLSIVFRSLGRIFPIFSFKDEVPKHPKSSVVYHGSFIQ